MKLVELLDYIDTMMPSEVEEKVVIGWLNAMEDKVYQEVISYEKLRDSEIEHKEKPIPMSLDDMDGDLDLLDYGYRWIQLYQYYAFYQICLVHEEYGKANNYISLFNATLTDFIEFYFSRMELPIRDARIKEWR